MKYSIDRACADCGYILSIEIGKGGHYSKLLGYFGKPFGQEYWECAICYNEDVYYWVADVRAEDMSVFRMEEEYDVINKYFTILSRRIDDELWLGGIIHE